ncbi:MAG: hypothetical protein CVV05_00205 [Gammaproteobacteria bacterium HGW-Gammaproteobacteria-1]|nr:MAG: hypothetical protein CVV05_00205 [Gammaproteobacteria bacterium HGW-Gammaproteobacteria-1]
MAAEVNADHARDIGLVTLHAGMAFQLPHLARLFQEKITVFSRLSQGFFACTAIRFGEMERDQGASTIW